MISATLSIRGWNACQTNILANTGWMTTTPDRLRADPPPHGHYADAAVTDWRRRDGGFCCSSSDRIWRDNPLTRNRHAQRIDLVAKSVMPNPAIPDPSALTLPGRGHHAIRRIAQDKGNADQRISSSQYDCTPSSMDSEHQNHAVDARYAGVHTISRESAISDDDLRTLREKTVAIALR